MWQGAAMAALGGGKGGAGMGASSSADMGADYSQTTMHGITFGQKSPAGADDMVKWLVIAVGLVAVAKIAGGK